MRRRGQLLSLALAACALASCATPYQPNGVRGGYEEIRRSYRSFEVWFYGNSSSSLERTAGFAMRRAAELTVASHFAGFLIANDLSEVLSGKRRNGSSYEMLFAHLVIETLSPEELVEARAVGRTAYDAREILAGNPVAQPPHKTIAPPRVQPPPHGFAMRSTCDPAPARGRGECFTAAASARPAGPPS